MNYSFKLSTAVIFIVLCSFGPVAKAQRASDKSINEIYNKKINEKLAEKTKSNQQVKPFQKEKDLPSERSSLKDIAKSKIKHPEIVASDKPIQSDEEKKKQLPSNSSKLKQIGAVAIKSSILPLK
jgi:hypothetical protein